MKLSKSLIAAALAAFVTTAPSAHDGEQHDGKHHDAASASEAPAAEAVSGTGTRDAREYFTDTALLDQHGKPVRFYSDVLEGRIVMINVIYTDCADACPLITRKINEVREAMGPEMESRVHFISISSDPERDSPQLLASFAEQNDAVAPNWTFLTGEKANVDHVLGRLGQLSETPEGHSTLLIAGDVPNKRWSKIRPDAPAVAIAERMKLLALPVGAR